MKRRATAPHGLATVAPRGALAAAAAVVLVGCGGAEPRAAAPPRVLSVHVSAGALDFDATAFAVGGGRAVTVAHVLRSGRPVLVADRRAPVLRVDRRLDVAVLATGARGPATRTAGARTGQRVTVRVLRGGAVRALHATVRRTISAHIDGAVRPALELAAAVMPGDSGAPVVDGAGGVVGVLFAQAADREGVAYALDARALGPLLAR
jgi:S1-C subfamily serine protease